MTARSPHPPAHLSAEMRRWWRTVVADYALDDHHRHLLTAAGEAHDRMTQARKIIDREGLVIVDRFGTPKAHPAVAIERDARIAFARLVRELQLDEDQAPDARPPRARRGGAR